MADPARSAADVEPREDKGWPSALWGLASFGLAAFLCFDLSAFEKDGGTRRVKWYIALLYNLLGKWGVEGLFVLLGVVPLGCALMKLHPRRAGN